MQQNECKGEKRYIYATIIERIRAMVRCGELAPGGRLPPERKLAETFGVSRGSLRQALQALAERRILERRQGDGTYLLTTLDAACTGDALVEAIREHSGFIHDIIEFRGIMEPQIAALAAQRVTPEAIDRLKILVCDQQRALLAGRPGGSFDAKFHQQLTVIAGNQVIGQVMATIASIVNESRSAWLQSSERLQASVTGHLRIIDALENRDAEAACTAMKNHIAEIENHIFGEPQEY